MSLLDNILAEVNDLYIHLFNRAPSDEEIVDYIAMNYLGGDDNV